MNGGIQFLTQPVSEHRPDESERWFQLSDSIAVGNVKTASENVGHDFTINDSQADFFFKVVKQPDVVVADQPDDFDACIGQTGESTEKPDVASWNDCAIFIPIVEYISNEKQRLRVVGD